MTSEQKVDPLWFDAVLSVCFRLIAYALGAAALFLFGAAVLNWLKLGYWITPSTISGFCMISTCSESSWAQNPTSWLGLYSILGSIPSWAACLVGCLICNVISDELAS